MDSTLRLNLSGVLTMDTIQPLQPVSFMRKEKNILSTVNIQKSVVFPYANNEQVKKEIKKTISFSIASKNI